MFSIFPQIFKCFLHLWLFFWKSFVLTLIFFFFCWKAELIIFIMKYCEPYCYKYRSRVGYFHGSLRSHVSNRPEIINGEIRRNGGHVNIWNVQDINQISFDHRSHEQFKKMPVSLKNLGFHQGPNPRPRDTGAPL